MNAAPSDRRTPAWFLPVWAGSAAIALALGAVIELPATVQWRTGLWLYWPGGAAVSHALLFLWVPAATAAVTLPFLSPSIPRRSMCLTLAATASLAVYTAAGLFLPTYHGLRLVCQYCIGAALIAAGVHVGPRFPSRRLPRVLAGLGGLLMVLCALFDGIEDRGWSLLYQLGSNLVDPFQLSSLYALALLSYAVLAVSFLAARHWPRGRGRLLRLLAYLLLLSLQPVLYDDWKWRTEELAIPRKLGLLAMGHTILLAAALAGWLEEILAKRAQETKNRPPAILAEGKDAGADPSHR